MPAKDQAAQGGPSSVAADKAALRKKMRDLRGSLPPERLKILGDAAQGHILASGIWRSARGVALFVSLPDEIPTNLLLRDAWQRRLRVFLPRVSDAARGVMEFVPCAGPEQLRPGPFGLREPAGELRGFGSDALGGDVLDIVILPGLAFDRAGTRLGYGAGYYDRFLRGGSTARRVGLCFAFQLVRAVPHTPWDVPVQYICTEERMLCL